LKTYANDKGIQIIGDIPLFVSPDSVDVWCHPEYFQVDSTSFKPKAVAGCPPDYFSKDGQFWGNPLYNWAALKKDGYSWWIERFKSSFSLVDVVRIDHFRGFESCWTIKAGAKTAAEGSWVKGPGLEVFKAIHTALPDSKIIAEDLGHITPEVTQLLEDTGLPGMAVLQFAFGGESDNYYLPHNLKENTVIYPGTHDNDTTLGWYETAGKDIQDHVRKYFDISGESVGWDFIRSSYRSVSKLAVISLQDLMSLDSAGRMNMPGTALGNWQWRYQTWQLELLTSESSEYLAGLSELYSR
ncbi:MAG: 4-alpha-glucanotransferase, partial [Verrucomicrobia bacterium]|nr:4-alpha-glucanotransferase [Verrucomicrobiota bacterium]